MATRLNEMTIDDFDAWCEAQKKFAAVAETADEGGGPRLSLVPAPQQNDAWPTDLLPAIPPGSGEWDRSPEQENGGGGEPATSAMPFDGVALPSSRNRLAGWSAERQRLFLTVLAETGSVHLASSTARLSARSAYALRARSPDFARAWNTAEQIAVGRLSALAFDRAINGRVEQVYSEGTLIAEKRLPNDKLLMWLLARLDPRRFALPWEQRGDTDPQAEALATFPALLEAVSDVAS